MRSDSQLPGQDFRRSEAWELDPLTGQRRPEIDRRYTQGYVEQNGRRLEHSFSGHERNCFFLNVRGHEFLDLSSLAGLDQIADGRSFAWWDFDRDGWQDIALVNANWPLLNVYRNRNGDRHDAAGAGMIAVRLVGGNQQAAPSTAFSARDGYGARIQIEAGPLRIQREHRCGEGFATQNSATILIGLADQPRADRVTVHWPSGKTQSIQNVAPGTLLWVYEDPEISPDKQPFVQKPYLQRVTDTAAQVAASSDHQPSDSVLQLTGWSHVPAGPQLHLLSTMATWCAACRAHLPQQRHLERRFGDRIQLWAIPVDSIETHEELQRYVTVHDPPYQMLYDVTEGDRTRIQAVLMRGLGTEALPATIVTDGQGRVLAAFVGVPSASEVARLLDNR